jgi:hypothetical protein
MNQRQIPPYVGVTGFTKEVQVVKLLSLIPENFSRKLMIGVLVDFNTLKGETRNGRFAKKDDIKNIFDISNDCDIYKKALNFVHYCDGYKRDLLKSLLSVTEISGENLHGFQLNMRWPDTNVIKEYKNAFPDKKFVLQMEEDDFLEYSPERMARELTKYDSLCDYVILDMSMGKGTQLDRVILTRYAKEIRQATNMNIVFAGGLHSGNLDIIRLILKKFPDMSIDAEGRLMTYPKNVLDVQEASSYLLKSLEIF